MPLLTPDLSADHHPEPFRDAWKQVLIVDGCRSVRLSLPPWCAASITRSEDKHFLDVPSAIADHWKTQEPWPVTADEIGQLEVADAARLHPLYREYLETFGYRQFDILEWSEIIATRSDDATIEENVTLSFLSPPESVLENLKVFGQPMELNNSVGPRIPPRMLPVGEAMMTMSGLVLMKSDDPDKGSLWYWDRVDETWGTGDNTVLWFLGRDLNDMLARVQIPKD